MNTTKCSVYVGGGGGCLSGLHNIMCISVRKQTPDPYIIPTKTYTAYHNDIMKHVAWAYQREKCAYILDVRTLPVDVPHFPLMYARCVNCLGCNVTIY